MNDASDLKFFATSPHACSYLPDRDAVTVFADPDAPKSPALYSALARFGFRRSGDDLYTPHCNACQACVPVRVDVADFSPRRIHRRILKRNQDLEERLLPAQFDDEHFSLYQRYQANRHGDGSMAEHGPSDYREFLLSTWSDTSLLELRLSERLLAVAVIDHLGDGWSSVYTFFDPVDHARSLGVHAILRTIALTQRAGLPWLYLGYWIAESPKMAYKRDYFPQQRYLNGQWQLHTQR